MLASLTMLESFIYLKKNLLTAVLMEDIADMKCQLHHSHFEECFIQQQKETISKISVIF